MSHHLGCVHRRFSLLEGMCLEQTAVPQRWLAGEVCGCWGLAPGSHLAFVLQKCSRPEALFNVVSEAAVSEDTVSGFMVWFGCLLGLQLLLSLRSCSSLWDYSRNLVGELVGLKNNPFSPPSFFACSCEQTACGREG